MQNYDDAGKKSFISQPVYLCGVTNASQSIFGTNQGCLCNLSLLVDIENLRKASNLTKKTVFQVVMWKLGVDEKYPANCQHLEEGHGQICQFFFQEISIGWLLLFLCFITGVEVAISQHLRESVYQDCLFVQKWRKAFEWSVSSNDSIVFEMKRKFLRFQSPEIVFCHSIIFALKACSISAACSTSCCHESKE